MAPPERGSAHPITAHYSFIDLEKMKGLVGLPLCHATNQPISCQRQAGRAKSGSEMMAGFIVQSLHAQPDNTTVGLSRHRGFQRALLSRRVSRSAPEVARSGPTEGPVRSGPPTILRGRRRRILAHNATVRRRRACLGGSSMNYLSKPAVCRERASRPRRPPD